MSVPTAMRSVAAAAAGCALVAVLASACSAPAPRDIAGETPPLRVMVKLVHGSDDAAAIGAEAARIAGVRVTYAASAGPQWHALALQCASSAECDAAIARLRAAGNVYQSVEIEGRKTRLSS
jgi:hypothetical protein